jgi:glucose/arabinose dehydrogenase
MRTTQRHLLLASAAMTLALGIAFPALAQSNSSSEQKPAAQQGASQQADQKSGQQNAAQPQATEVPEEHGFAGGESGAAGPAGNYDRILDPSAISVPEGYEIEVLAKDLNYPTDITFGDNGEAYVSEAGGHFYGTDPSKAPPPRILQVMPDGTTKVVYDNAVPYEQIQKAKTYEEIPEGLIGPIEGVTYNPDNGLLYIAHRTRYSTLDPKTGEFKTIIDNLPAWGIFHNTKVLFDDQGRMIFGVSAQGNSGPVDFAIMKVISFYNKPEVREVPCEDVTLTGEDYAVADQFTEIADAKLTGVFVPYGEETEPGQTIKGEFWCNSALYRANADGSNPERLAWGIRNAFHYEFGPDGEFYFSNNSGNPIPGRPVYDDWETIYRLEEGAWYGWPDYYSSLPITDERFKAPDDPQFKGEPFPHAFALTEETRNRLLKGEQTPPEPLVRIEPHAAAQGFIFASESFGLGENEILLAEFGAVIPYEVAGEDVPGFQVSRINLESGERQPFARNKSGKPASAAPGQPEPQGGGFERPLRLEHGPNGALYVVDFGVFDVSPKPKDKPTKMSFADSGVIWKVTRTEQKAEAQESKPDQAASSAQQNAQEPGSGVYAEWAGEDGKLTIAEWDSAIDGRFGEQAVDLAAAEWDTNADGVISREEFEKAAAESGLLSKAQPQ